jgi:hypothetical protein
LMCIAIWSGVLSPRPSTEKYGIRSRKIREMGAAEGRLIH